MSEIMSRLKTETREAHTATERTELARAMLHGTMSLAEYKAQLGFYLAVHTAIEARHASIERVAQVAGGRSKAARIRRDLEALPAVTAGDASALDLATARACAHARAASEAELLGMMYVLEGSSLGAAILYPRLKEALALPDEALGYYRGSGAATLDEWRAFGARMNATLESDDEQTEALAGARAMFVHIRAAFEAMRAPAVVAVAPQGERSVSAS
jgi:heme oxygenase